MGDWSDHKGNVAGDVIIDAGIAKLAAIDLTTLPQVAADRIAPCVGGFGNLISIGLNQADHFAESGMEIPQRQRRHGWLCLNDRS